MMNKREFQIVSPPFPSGVTWLINLLLELNIKTSNVGFENNHWLEKKNGTTLIDPSAFEHLQWHLPILGDRTTFEFTENIEVFWEHRLDLARHTHRPTILFIRDPRDAIYSLYIRNYKTLFEFNEYLQRPDKWPDHFPELFNLPPIETYAMFCFFWEQLKNVLPILVIRFEDMRANPLEVSKKILSFLQLSRDDIEIERALELSTFERAKKTVMKLTTQTSKNFPVVRQGKVNEWKQTYTKKQLAIISSSLFRDMMTHFNYEAMQSTAHLKTHTLLQYLNIKFIAKLGAGILEKKDLSTSKLKIADDWTYKIFGTDFKDKAVLDQSSRFFFNTLVTYQHQKSFKELILSY